VTSTRRRASAAKSGVQSRAWSPSAIGSALLAVGDQWTLFILQRAFLLHTRRFNDWRDSLGISESVLADRINEMVSANLLVPASYRTDGRARTEYLLSDKAIDLWPFMVAIFSWERRWVDVPPGAPTLFHETCGQSTEVELGCGHCNEHPVTARDTTATRGESETFANVAVPRHHRRTARTADAVGGLDPLSYYPQTMAIVGDRWSTIVLAAALLRVRRFRDFQNQLRIAPSVLSSRLALFVELDVFRRAENAAGKDEYRLTEKGLDFFPIYAFLIEWAQRWYKNPVGGGLTTLHRECGNELLPQLYCKRCRQPVTRQSVHFDIP
jgi:DNA-binding HxlR family transcriptional regulator